MACLYVICRYIDIDKLLHYHPIYTDHAL